ncbi:tRNA pseudouridine(38-40) synthase TruA [Aureispira sp. CCB-QB1]|uniref:tRNA pseudouridine(38-40) synthase TruA n=1 Tax=Aureispira sp. CCB-QB1 TaxID=1313421 RepID=UPI000697F507|nr:tRNA pseudouridine(38-40) synthase TruA [Aureispira sp. CCB-QB1]
MTRYFFHIAYNGIHYRGWQRQPNVHSIQEVIENKLAKALRLPSITIIGCGRTDAGVHASQFFFHTDLKHPIRDDLKFVLNKILPPTIAVFDIIPTTPNLHARFSAKERTYDYFIHTHKDPFIDQTSSLYVDYQLNLVAMKQAVDLLTKYKDYAAFCKQPDLHNTTICDVRSATLFQNEERTKLRFRIVANRFLRGQIRIIVQKLLEIGVGKFSLDAFEACLKHKKRPQLIRPALPQGLFLSKIYYPDLDLPNKATYTLPNSSWQEIKI